MKTTRVLISALLLCLILTGCGKQKAADFRSVNWGDTQAKVHRSEDIEYAYADDELVMYITEMGGEPIEVYYTFEDNRLIEAEVKFIIGERLLTDIVESYDNMAEYLTEIYGEPINPDKLVWLEDSEDFRNDVYGTAIYFEKLEFLLEWKTDTTYARLELSYSSSKNVITYLLYAKDINL